MIKHVFGIIFSAMLTLSLLACSPNEPGNDPAIDTVPASPSSESVPTIGVSEEPADDGAVSFTSTTYRDELHGFELEHPESWTVSDPPEQYSRGSIVQLTAEGEPVLDIAVQLWEPTNDLEAFIELRNQAWEGSGTKILSEDRLSIDENVEGARFVVRTASGEEAMFFYAAIGDRYLALSGAGDVALLSKIVETVRLLQVEDQADSAEALDCLTDDSSSIDWLACNLIDGIRSRNLYALHGFMADPFAMLYWQSEGRFASPEDVTNELSGTRLPMDASMPMTFTTDRAQFPDLMGQSPEAMLGPDVGVKLAIFSEGWGPDGNGEAILLITGDEEGTYLWQGVLYSPARFDR